MMAKSIEWWVDGGRAWFPQKAQSRSSSNSCVTGFLLHGFVADGSCARHEFRGHDLAWQQQQGRRGGERRGGRGEGSGFPRPTSCHLEPLPAALAPLVPAAFSFLGTDWRDHESKTGFCSIIHRWVCEKTTAAKPKNLVLTRFHLNLLCEPINSALRRQSKLGSGANQSIWDPATIEFRLTCT